MTDGRPTRAQEFSYDSHDLSADGVLTCRYSVDDFRFEETFVFSSPGNFTSGAAQSVARLVFLLAGISYYKTGAPPVIRVPGEGLTVRERVFLLDFYKSGLAEFSYRDGGIDISDLHIEAATRASQAAGTTEDSDRPLVPFGGGIDSIVVASRVAKRWPDAALFIANTSDTPFAPIEETAALTGLPIHRLRRHLDPQVLRSAELGWFNGHVPVTGVLSAAAALSAVANGFTQVIMSNEHSASEPTQLRANGVRVNHQWSKSAAFEEGFREVLAEAISGFEYYSALRPRSELWVGREFSKLTEFHGVFRSCNRAFFVNPENRLDKWCGRCDKCCFIDLILAPYLARTDLESIFGGSEPLQDPSLQDVFRSLLGQPGMDKPLECVGDENECRTAVHLAAQRPDRARDRLLADLAAYLRDSRFEASGERELMARQGPHHVPAGLL